MWIGILTAVTIPCPFLAAAPRVRWLRAVLLGSTLLGMLSCIPLWLATR